jgi:hypothetical protein
MIENRYQQRDLVLLALSWVLAAMTQLLLCNLISTVIWLYVFKEDFLSSYRIIEWIVSVLRERLFWGFCLGVFFGWRTLLLDGQIELETSLLLTGVVGVFFGFLPVMVGNGHPNWVYPIFFMECAPLCALFWQLLHLGELRFVNWQLKRVEKAKKLEGDLKAVKAESPSIVTEQRQVPVEETKSIKKEDKPIEKPKEPPEAQNSTDNWSLD